MCQQGQQGRERTQSGREQNEEGQLLLRVHAHLVEGCQVKR